ncbi:MAG TPA: ABC transporter ATP-binding protein [Polyangia bacterium]
MSPPRLELVNVSKTYPGVKANDRVSLQVMPGEIHAILGENGAGKSTLMKIIYGAVRPDEGEVRWNGEPLRITSPRHARALGIAMVFQHFALFDALTVAENVWLGLDASFSRPALLARIAEIARAHALDEAPDRLAERRVGDLSVGERQRVEILRALLTEPRLLILDEPTSVLTPQAAESLFTTLRRLAADGCSILYISHKLHEVRALCTRCTVLRGGRVTATVDPRAETNQTLSELMLGAAPPALAPAAPPSGDASAGPAALEVRALSLPQPERFGVALAGISFTVRAGEILGIAGISGSGQGELLDAISGEEPRIPLGSITLGGVDVAGTGSRARRARGLCTVPEERIGRGAVPTLSLSANTLLTRRDPIARSGLLSWRVARRLASRLIANFGVRTPGTETRAGSLSGGNLQKFIVGREIDARPRVLVVAQPTWGLDVGAAAQIRGALRTLAEEGVAVLVISEDLEELFELCAELVVMARGRLSRRLAVRDATVAQIGAWMSGHFGDGAPAASDAPRPASEEAHA